MKIANVEEGPHPNQVKYTIEHAGVLFLRLPHSFGGPVWSYQRPKGIHPLSRHEQSILERHFQQSISYATHH